MKYVRKSKADIIAKYAGMQKMFPGLKDSVINIFSSGNSVLTEFISSGLSPDGTSWSIPICTVLTYRNGKIIKDATYYDLQK